jgi:exodeoxyribonuclease VII small subunit
MSKELSFEEKLNKLEEIVSELEQGNIDLDDAINKYTEAMKLAKECSKKLDDATKAVNKILNADGKLEDFKELEKEEE